MNGLETPELIKITKRYQIVRTTLNVFIAILLALLLWQQNSLAKANRKTLIQLQDLGKANHQIQVSTSEHVDCIAKLFIDGQPPTDNTISKCK